MVDFEKVIDKCINPLIYFYGTQVVFSPPNLGIMAFAVHSISWPFNESINDPGSRSALAFNGRFQRRRLTCFGGMIVVKFRAYSRKSRHSQLIRPYRNYNELDLRCSNLLRSKRENVSSILTNMRVPEVALNSYLLLIC